MSDRLRRAILWLEYLPHGLRRAWCELSGGHRSHLLQSWGGSERATHVAWTCERCGFQSRWFPTTKREASNL